MYGSANLIFPAPLAGFTHGFHPSNPGSSAARSAEVQRQILSRIEAEDDQLENNLREMLSTHPMTVRRLKALREYAVSQEYHRLQAQVNHAHPI